MYIINKVIQQISYNKIEINLNNVGIIYVSIDI